MHPVTRALHARVEDRRTVDAYYAPLARGCAACLERSPRKPWVLGIQGPQGCGKTTLASAMVDAFSDIGVRAFSVSIDDFYLTYDEQRAVAQRHPGNRTLLYRGYPGTHDVGLGRRTLDSLVSLEAGIEMQVPTYDKSAREGRGDRAPVAQWRRVVGPLELLIVEGWMLGFERAPEDMLGPDLRAPNAYLGAYRAWTEMLNAFVHLDVRTPDTIVRWRVDAERARRDRGEVALSEPEARDYIERFLPAYEAYVPRLRAKPPCAVFWTTLLEDDRTPAAPWQVACSSPPG